MNNLTIKSIASSSLGNCYTVDDGKTKLLIECGIPVKKIRQALDFNMSGVSGCLVSHFHQDHCKAVRDVMKGGIDCYMSQGTINGLGLTGHRVKQIEPKKRFEVGSFHIMPFESIHDCEGSLGFLLASHGDKLLFATDTAYIPYKFKGITTLAIECNYQTEILERNIESGAVSVSQKNRLLFSHFSLENVLKFIGEMDRSKLREVHLLHLSNGNSNSNEMKRQVMALTGLPVIVCSE